MYERLVGQAQEFCQRLARLDRGERARLRRNAGRTLAESRDVMGLFFQLLPPGVHPRDEETFFLIATLFPLAGATDEGNLGDALRRAVGERDKQGVERRLQRLLDADAQQLPFRLRQCVRFLASKGVPVNWAGLLRDVRYWNHPKHLVQQRWARHYFAPHTIHPNASTTEQGKES